MTDKQVQLLLLYLGYDPGEADGIMGKNTRAAVKAFQRDNGLTQDGIVGQQTEGRLLEAVCSGRFAADSDEVRREEKTGTFWDEIRYFSRSDPYIGCSCGVCGGFPVEPSEKLMRLADKVRTAVGRPMVPTSTVRCDTHNRAVGGVETSRHKKGTAMDFVIPGMTANEILGIVRRSTEVACCYAINDTAVHMDVVER